MKIRISVSRIGVVESYRRGLPIWRLWHWRCEACDLTDEWGYRSQRKAKLAMVDHIKDRHPPTFLDGVVPVMRQAMRIADMSGAGEAVWEADDA